MGGKVEVRNMAYVHKHCQLRFLMRTILAIWCDLSKKVLIESGHALRVALAKKIQAKSRTEVRDLALKRQSFYKRTNNKNRFEKAVACSKLH